MQGVKPEIPPCSAEYLVCYLFEIGPGTSGNPISQSELAHWQQNSGIELNAWEADTLRRLSIAYLKQAQNSTDIACDPPFQTEEGRKAQALAKAEYTKRNLRDLAGKS